MAGEPTRFFVLERGEGFYYAGYGKPWPSQIHQAAFLNDELAEQLVRRYPGARISVETGYDPSIKWKLADVGEPSAVDLLKQAVRTAQSDGMSLDTLTVTIGQVFNGKS